jgi:hypothetical protein
MKTSKSLAVTVLIIGAAWAQKPADRDHQTPSAAATKPAELKTQTYKGTLMDASCAPASNAPASKESSRGKATAADQSQGCRVSASTKEFALHTDSAETLRFDSVGNARAQEAFKNKKKWSNDAAAGKPIRAKVTANANGDKLTVMSIN